MARIAGVNIPNNAHIVIGLQAIYGIGATRAKLICEAANIAPTTKAKDLDEAQLDALREQVAKYEVEGDLRREVTMSIKTTDGYGLLSRLPSSSWLALSWSTHSHKCSYP